MKSKLFLLVALLLAACGNNPDRSDLSASLKAVGSLKTALLQRRGGAPDPAQVAALRAALQAGGQPVISTALPDKGWATFMVPYFPSRTGAQTWSSEAYETVTLRDDMLVWTRGLGADLMASQVPGRAQVASGEGSFHRIYEYLDGSDSPVQEDFDCDFSSGGRERIAILGLAYDTRVVVEDCSRGEQRFRNRYWFDASGKMRQSEQLLVPGAAPMLIQRIIE